MSAEAYAEERYDVACRDLAFVNRVTGLGVPTSEVVVVADSTPVGEVVSRVRPGTVVAVHDEDAPHQFILLRVGEVDQ